LQQLIAAGAFLTTFTSFYRVRFDFALDVADYTTGDQGGVPMRKRNNAFVWWAFVISMFLHADAFAGGWGPYFSWGRDAPTTGIPESLMDQFGDLLRGMGVSEDLINRAKELARETETDTRVNHITLGVIYDSATSRDKLINHRFTLGFDIATSVSIESAEVEIPGYGPIDVSGIAKNLGVDIDKSGYGVTAGYTLGFGIVRTDLLKWWLGPGLRFNFDYYNLDKSFKGGNMSIGGGGETGVNIHVTPEISLCVAGGVHWNAFAYGMGSESQSLGSFVWGNGPFYFVHVSALFHTGPDSDAWQPKAPSPPPAPAQGESPVLTPVPEQ